jgi:hypothetical protein
MIKKNQNKKIGYAICTEDLIEDQKIQYKALRNAGVLTKNMYFDFQGNIEQKGINYAITSLRKGDILISPNFYRLANSEESLRIIAQVLKNKGASLEVANKHYSVDQLTHDNSILIQDFLKARSQNQVFYSPQSRAKKMPMMIVNSKEILV